MKISFFYKLLIIATIMTSVLGCSSDSRDTQDSEKRSVLVTTSPNETIVSNQNQSSTTTSTSVTTTVGINKVTSIASKSTVSDSKEQTEATVHFLDTGNSDAILIRQGDKTILIDGADTDDGASLVKYLKNTGVKDIDYMINTHPDADHVGGLSTVMSEFPIKYFSFQMVMLIPRHIVILSRQQES